MTDEEERRATAVEVLTVQLRDVLGSAATWRQAAEAAARQMAMQTQRDDATIEILKDEIELLRGKYRVAQDECRQMVTRTRDAEQNERMWRERLDPVLRRCGALQSAIDAHRGEPPEVIVRAARVYDAYAAATRSRAPRAKGAGHE